MKDSNENKMIKVFLDVKGGKTFYAKDSDPLVEVITLEDYEKLWEVLRDPNTVLFGLDVCKTLEEIQHNYSQMFLKSRGEIKVKTWEDWVLMKEE